MSKYNLTDLLSEVKGGRIGTLNITAMDLERKMEELEGEGIKVSTFDGDNFGKTYIEYHVHPENKYDPDESFSIYDYKFGEDPTDIDNEDKEYPFSIGGMSAALNSAKALLGAGQASYSIDEGEAVDLAIEASQEKAGIKENNKKRMNEVRIEREVANRIEGLMNIQLKAKFLDVFEDLWLDLIEEDPFYAEDVINHLNNEMHKRIDDRQAQGDRLANTPEIPMFKGTRDALDDISIRETDAVNFNMKADTDYDEGLEDIEEIDSTLDPYEDRDEIIKQVMSLLIKEKGASREELKGFIEMHIEDILNAEDDDAIVDEFSQYLSVNESDKALQEHFKRFK